MGSSPPSAVRGWASDDDADRPLFPPRPAPVLPAAPEGIYDERGMAWAPRPGKGSPPGAAATVADRAPAQVLVWLRSETLALVRHVADAARRVRLRDARSRTAVLVASSAAVISLLLAAGSGEPPTIAPAEAATPAATTSTSAWCPPQPLRPDPVPRRCQAGSHR